MKRIVFLAMACVALVACNKGNEDPREKRTMPADDPHTVAMELSGQVKSVTETDHGLLSPELFYYSSDSFDPAELNDYIVRAAAYEYRVVDEEADPEDNEFFYELPFSERYYNAEDHEFNLPYTKYIFDKDGYETEQLQYRDPTKPVIRTVYTRDEKHRETRSEFFRNGVLDNMLAHEYNADGFITKYVYWTRDNGYGEESESVTTYYYDDKNYTLYEEEFKNDTFASKTVYAYDQYGNELEETHTGEWDAKWAYDYLYGEGENRDRMTMLAFYSPHDKLETVRYYTFTEDMSGQYEADLNGEGDTTAVHFYRFDDKTRITHEECTIFGRNGEKDFRYTDDSEIDENDNMTFYSHTSTRPGDVYSVVYKYDDKQRIVEVVNCNQYDGPLQIRTVTTYGANGKVVREDTYVGVLHPDCNVPEMPAASDIWTYDEHDNWIKKETYYYIGKQPQLFGLITREIEYY